MARESPTRFIITDTGFTSAGLANPVGMPSALFLTRFGTPDEESTFPDDGTYLASCTGFTYVRLGLDAVADRTGAMKAFTFYFRPVGGMPTAADVTTDRGISRGATIDDVLAAYGPADSREDYRSLKDVHLYYRRGNVALEFQFHRRDLVSTVVLEHVEPPTRDDVARCLRQLINGELTREAASTWARRMTRFDQMDTDDRMRDALSALVSADAPSTDRDYLYDQADFEEWLRKFLGARKEGHH